MRSKNVTEKPRDSDSLEIRVCKSVDKPVFTPLVFEFHDKSARKKIPKADRVVRYAETRAERLKREFAILRAPCVCVPMTFLYICTPKQ